MPKNLADEKYKYRLVQSFQENWRKYEAGQLSITNLMDGKQFGNLVYMGLVPTVFGQVARERPAELEQLLNLLFDESKPLEERIPQYIQEFKEVYQTVVRPGPNTGQDERTIATLLTFRYPDKYTLFKYGFYAPLSKSFGIKPKSTGEQLLHYYSMVSDLLKELGNHPDIFQWEMDNLETDCYPDPNHLLLAQDVFYTLLDSKENDSDISISDDDDNVIAQPALPVLQSKKQTQNMSHPLNLILYGPPGTGKTYNSIYHALSIIEGKDVEVLKKEPWEDIKGRFDALLIRDLDLEPQPGRIGFITFHQSLSYEDFIEGIKPKLADDEEGDLAYRVKPGLFKYMSTIAQIGPDINKNPGFETVYQKLLSFISSQTNGEHILYTLKREKPFTISINRNNNIRFHANTEKAYEAVIRKEFLQAYLETGIAPDWVPYTSAIGEFMKTQFNYSDSPTISTAELKPYVLVIDEINRGNVSQIFGELITLIEPSKRKGTNEELGVILPYSNEFFQAPPNLYVIGTMNTADRSVEALDTALRRRFSFKEMMPDEDLKDIRKVNMAGTDIDFKEVLHSINKRLEKLAGRDHKIGHSYLMSTKDEEWLFYLNVFRDKIIPLLQEYFYGDYAKMCLVLGKGFVDINASLSDENDDKFFADAAHDALDDFRAKQVWELKKISTEQEFATALATLLNK
ncbi:MAG: AAA family ATPase [Bacteroidetes bacterium]|nr:AAA family ATPase [Bacteroidota bacterium]